MKRTFHIAILVLIASLLTVWTGGPFVLSPNKYITQTTGDGLKAYYIPAYHLKYGEGLHFDGLNYPYGEHIFFTDSQPAVLFALKFIDKHFFSVEGKIVGIFNFSKYANLVLCALFFFLLLRKFNLPAWYAIPIALMITFLSPQLPRTLGHYSLSYAFFFPMLWYLLIHYFERTRPVLIGITIFISLMFFGLVHMYYLPIGVLFILGFSLFCGLQLKNRKGFSWKPVIWINLAGIGAMFLIQMLATSTDPVVDRSSYPFGFFHYHAFLGSIFLPPYGPLNDLANAVFVKVTSRFESQVYIGLVGVAFSVVVLFKILKALIRKRFVQSFLLTKNAYLNAALWASVVALIFSMALPFRWGMEFLLDWFPFIRQFRSPGRFAWIFYYVIGVYSAYYFFLFFRAQRILGNKFVFLTGMGLIFLAWGFDVFVHLDHHRKVRSNPHPNTYFTAATNHFESLLELKGYRIDDFQAILPLPYISIGSQKFEFVMGLDAFSQSVKCSYETGLPIAGGILSRSSIGDVSNLLQIFNPPFSQKAVLDDLPNDKPFLIIKTEEALNPFEKRLLTRCQMIGAYENVSLFKLTPSELNDSTLVKNRFDQKDNLFKIGDFYSSDSMALIHRNTFEPISRTPMPSFHGHGSAFLHSGKLNLYYGKFPKWQKPVEMEASVWVFIDHDIYLFPKLRAEQFDANGNKVGDKATLPQRVPENDHGWVRASTTFILNSPDDSMHIFMDGKRTRIDEFLIRPLHTDIFYDAQEDGSFMFNNYFVRASEN